MSSSGAKSPMVRDGCSRAGRAALRGKLGTRQRPGCSLDKRRARCNLCTLVTSIPYHGDNRGVWVPTSSPSVSLGLGDPTAGRSGAISLRENVSSRAGQPGLGQARYLGSGVLLPRAPGLFTILASMGHGNGALRGYTGSRSSFPQGPRQDPSRLLSYPLPDTCRYMIMHLHGLARWEGRTGVPPPLRKAPGCPCKGSFFRTGMIGRETRALQG